MWNWFCGWGFCLSDHYCLKQHYCYQTTTKASNVLYAESGFRKCLANAFERKSKSFRWIRFALTRWKISSEAGFWGVKNCTSKRMNIHSFIVLAMRFGCWFQVVAEARSSEAFVALCLLTVAGTSLITQKLGFSDTVWQLIMSFYANYNTNMSKYWAERFLIFFFAARGFFSWGYFSGN